jgi:hypothetical protein
LSTCQVSPGDQFVFNDRILPLFMMQPL